MSAKKKFINNPDNVVPEMLEGLMLCNSGRLVKLPDKHVVVRADIMTIMEQEVTIVSGGGSGHEPAFAGYVGDGMLTASVCGEVFTSPSTSAVLAAIRATCGPKGCLVLVMNYTGDKINFGTAVERAELEGFKVKMHVVGDDCAQPKDKGITGRRGLAGVVLVAKIAGAAAKAGKSLDEVVAEAASASENVGTLGVALSTCTTLEKTPSDPLDANTIEIGLGIHGEAGIERTSLKSADVLAERMVSAIVDPVGNGGHDYLRLSQGQRVVVLVNSLGGTPSMEQMVIVRRAASDLTKRGSKVERIYCGAFMTSLKMEGVSVTVMRVDDESLSRLDAVTDAPGWRNAYGTHSARAPVDETQLAAIAAAAAGLRRGSRPEGQPASEPGKAVVSPGEWSTVAKAVRAVAEALITAEPALTEWDTIAGDGDCGTTLKRGAEAVLLNLDAGELPRDDMCALLRALSESIESMGGTIGSLLQIFFNACKAYVDSEVAVGLGSQGDLSGLSAANVGEAWCGAFIRGVEEIGFRGRAKPGMRTLLDAVVPAAEVLRARGAEGFEEAVIAAEEGAEKTSDMLAEAGRSSNVRPEDIKGVPDPGAKAAAIMLRALADQLRTSS